MFEASLTAVTDENKYIKKVSYIEVDVKEKYLSEWQVILDVIIMVDNMEEVSMWFIICCLLTNPLTMKWFTKEVG